MTKEQMSAVLKNLHEQEHQMREAGQAEYAHNDGNAFANFDRIAEQTGTDRESVLFVYFLKHVDGIASYIQGYRSQRESIMGRIVDARVYLALLAGMVVEDGGDRVGRIEPDRNEDTPTPIGRIKDTEADTEGE